MSIRTRIVTLVILLSVGLGSLGYVAGGAFNEAESASNLTRERCESGNVLRKGLRSYFNSVILESKSIDLSKVTIIGLSQAEIERLNNAKIHRLEYDINHRFAESQC